MPAATACPSDCRASNLGRAELEKQKSWRRRKNRGTDAMPFYNLSKLTLMTWASVLVSQLSMR